MLVRTVSGKLMLATGLAITLILAGFSGWSAWHSSGQARDQVMELATERAERLAHSVSVNITEATAAGGSVAGMISGYLADGTAERSEIIDMLREVPGRSETVFGAWMAGALDSSLNDSLSGEGGMNEQGVFTPYWTRGPDGEVNFSTFSIDTEAQWYALPAETGRSVITEPYLTEDDQLLSSVTAPVMVDGDFLGVAGVDIELTELTAMLAEMRTFEAGQSYLVDSGGKWIAHPNADYVTQPYEEIGAEELREALLDGEMRVIEGGPDGATRLIYPFSTPGMNTTWAAVLDVPESYFSEPVRAELIAGLISGLLTLVAALAVMAVASMLIVRKPLAKMLGAVNELAEGDYERPVPFAERRDEIGAMAGSVEALRLKLAERARMEEERAERAAEQKRVVEISASGLRGLAKGNLDVRIETEFPEDYEQLRVDFNETVSRLTDLVRSIHTATSSIANGVAEITSSSDGLSRRTETTAATLEETAAALSELTSSVRNAADSAGQVDSIVGDANIQAQSTSHVVKETVSAMSEIEASSEQITKIINVIDDIAFQTNLLALNAGVEAARAGEAGRGFAVVASEVRALAQRSSEAAGEIGALISNSDTQVRNGVELVGRAGEALQAIVRAIGDISGHVSGIAASASEQASGLGEINTAVDHLDKTQQQNVAMFEETTAACMALNKEARGLSQLVQQFRLPDEGEIEQDRAA